MPLRPWPLLAAAALLAGAAPSARGAPPRDDPDSDRGAGAPARSPTGDGPERDDPGERLRAREALEGPVSAEARLRALREALRERERIGPLAASSPAPAGAQLSAAAPLTGTSWVNLGPATALSQVNDIIHINGVDSGRVRAILPSPVDAQTLYLGTSGGGVWRTRDGGQSWQPLTDQLGALAVGGLAMDPTDPQTLWLGLGDFVDARVPGLTITHDGGASWSTPAILTATYGGINVIADSTRAIAIDPGRPLHALVATDAGLFQTQDGGGSFQAVALPSGSLYSMWSVAWLGGNTWLASGQVNPNPLAANAPELSGNLALFRSADGGQSWIDVTSALPNSGVPAGRSTLAVAASTVVDPSTARAYLLLGSADGTSQLDLLRTDDGGQTFVSLKVNGSATPLNANGHQGDLNLMRNQAWYNQALTVDPRNADAVYLGGQFAMARSLDGGTSWVLLSDWLPGDLSSSVAPAYVHADFHALALSTAPGAHALWAGTDGGLFRSANFDGDPTQVTFDSSVNNGLVTHLFYSVSCAPPSWPASLAGFAVGGLQDNGTRVRDAASGIWTNAFDQVIGGDGIGTAVSGDTVPIRDANNNIIGYQPAVVLGSAEHFVLRSTDGGRSFASFMTGLPGMPFFVRLARDASAPDPQTFLTISAPPDAAYSQVLRSVGGAAWVQIQANVHWLGSNWGSAKPDTVGFTTPVGEQVSLRNLTVHATQTGLYGLVSGAYAYVSRDAGQTWVASVQPMPAGSPAGSPGTVGLAAIALDPSDTVGQRYYIGSAAHQLAVPNTQTVAPIPDSFGHLFVTQDGGASWRPLTGSTGHRLPNVPVHAILVDPASTSTQQILYVATDVGVYRSVDGGNTFDRFGNGLPLVQVNDFCLSGNSLTAATFGRGLWELNVAQAGSSSLVPGKGDLNGDLRLDGFDLLDLTSALGQLPGAPGFRNQANLTGSAQGISDADLAAFLSRFGGAP